MTSGNPSKTQAEIKQIKATHDLEVLKKSARFVIVIDKDRVVQLIDNHDLNREGHLIPLIVVAGPYKDKTGEVFDISLLEIGYHRARPYRRVHTDRNKVLVYERARPCQLSAEQSEEVYPYLLSCFETIVEETRAGWRNQEPWFVNGRAIERGVQITIHKSDVWLYRALLSEHVRFFGECIFPKYLKWLGRRMKFSRYNRYSPKLYGPSVKLAVSSVYRSEYLKDPLLLEALLRKFERRLLLIAALSDLHGFHHEWDDDTDLVFGSASLVLPNPSKVLCYKTKDQPPNSYLVGQHAIGCARFEIIPDRQKWQPENVSSGEGYYEPPF